jgi:hypothetical protein
VLGGTETVLGITHDFEPVADARGLFRPALPVRDARAFGPHRPIQEGRPIVPESWFFDADPDARVP